MNSLEGQVGEMEVSNWTPTREPSDWVLKTISEGKPFTQ
jgi:hypothetical protein